MCPWPCDGVRSCRKGNKKQESGMGEIRKFRSIGQNIFFPQILVVKALVHTLDWRGVVQSSRLVVSFDPAKFSLASIGLHRL
mmetsp:Transcript_12527/g.25946  ORF Transcript_12527/g.25946 Transcript_12527/m.25946 type:complete len:82 (-) Transcript_12527:200-445(-)